MADSVEIPGVTIRGTVKHDGEPLVFITTSPDGPGQAAINFTAQGITEDQLCALLRVIATTLEERDLHPPTDHLEDRP